jgi:hypothetical protein
VSEDNNGDEGSNGNWDSCKMWVLRELKRMNNMLSKMDDDIGGISIQMTSLKVKMAFIGAIAGLVAGAILRLVIK